MEAVIKLSAHLGFQFNEVPFYDRFALAARCGYRAVEFPSPYGHDIARVKDLLVSHDLELTQIAAPMGNVDAGDKGLAALPGRRKEFLAGLVTARDTALALDCSRIHVMSGVIAPDTEHDWVTYVDSLRIAIELFAAARIKTLVEVMSPEETPGYFMSSFELAASLFSAIPADDLEFLFDTYHAAALSGDVLGTLVQWLPRIGHIQISDRPGRHEPGTGTLPFDEIFGTLQRHGYQGWVGCEYRPLAGTVPGLRHLAPYLSPPGPEA